MDKLISVIVPIYNVEKYLYKCIGSILNQTYRNLEIILVDDGSPDNCGEICDEYAKKDTRIRVIHKENGGLSDARNAGIDAAKGAYLAFVDSDDYIAPRMIEILYNRIIEDESQIALCNYTYVDEDEKEILEINNKSPIKDEVLTSEEVINKLCQNMSHYYVVAWNKLYKKEVFDGIRYPKGKIHEDEFVIHHLINNCNKISCIQQPLYYYLQRNDSIMGNFKNKKKIDYVEFFFERAKFMIDSGRNETAYVIMEKISQLYFNISSFSGDKAQNKKIIKNIYKELARKIDKKNLSIKRKAIILVNCFSFKILYVLKRCIRLFSVLKQEISHLTKTLFYVFYNLVECYLKRRKIIYLMQTAEHGNVGDAAIAYSEHKFFKDFFSNYAVCEISGIFMKNSSRIEKNILYYLIKNQKIAITGGGFLGTLWLKEEEIPLRQLLENVSDADVTILPQTIFYENSEFGKSELEKSKNIYRKNKNLRIVTREKMSYDLANENYTNAYMIPDMVMYLNYSDMQAKYVRSGIKICLRNDREGTIEKSEHEKIYVIAKKLTCDNVKIIDMVINESITKDKRQEIIYNHLNEFFTSKLVITDRLHGMIFAAITATPCIVFGSKSYKVKGCYDWISHLPYIRFAENIDDIEKIYHDISGKKYVYDNSNLIPFYKKLSDILRME